MPPDPIVAVAVPVLVQPALVEEAEAVTPVDAPTTALAVARTSTVSNSNCISTAATFEIVALVPPLLQV